jgi:hypothetical protein
MELKNRSFRIADETADFIKAQSDATGAPMYVILAAAAEWFNPAGNPDHAESLAKTRMKFNARDIAAQIQEMSPEIRAALIKQLKAK